MPAYVVVQAEPLNLDEYRVYQQQVLPTIERHGGRFLVRGGTLELLEGTSPGRLVVIEFPSPEHAQAWYRSPEYQAIVPIRHQHGRTSFMVIAPGVQPIA
jgi:uncharacterized protein (DUF1330 family)